MIATQIQYRERSDRMPGTQPSFYEFLRLSSVPASGRCARGTVLRGDTNRTIHAQSPSFYPPARWY